MYHIFPFSFGILFSPKTECNVNNIVKKEHVIDNIKNIIHKYTKRHKLLMQNEICNKKDKINATKDVQIANNIKFFIVILSNFLKDVLSFTAITIPTNVE